MLFAPARDTGRIVLGIYSRSPCEQTMVRAWHVPSESCLPFNKICLSMISPKLILRFLSSFEGTKSSSLLKRETQACTGQSLYEAYILSKTLRCTLDGGRHSQRHSSGRGAHWRWAKESQMSLTVSAPRLEKWVRSRSRTGSPPCRAATPLATSRMSIECLIPVTATLPEVPPGSSPCSQEHAPVNKVDMYVHTCEPSTTKYH